MKQQRIKFWRTPQFRELQKQWDVKLIQSGFNDVEKPINGKRVLKQRSYHCYCWAKEQIQRENKARYYELLGIYFHEENFTDPVHQLVMERRADGVKIVAISEELKRLGERNHRQTIRNIIKRYELKWGIKR